MNEAIRRCIETAQAFGSRDMAIIELNALVDRIDALKSERDDLRESLETIVNHCAYGPDLQAIAREALEAEKNE